MQIEQNKIVHSAREISVSCLMVALALPERLAFAKKSIDNFCRQTLANKVLVLVLNGGVESVHRAIRDYVESLGRDDIQIFTAPHGLNLGQLRNFSLEVATGDILCQWDDDDLYHPERLERQLSLLLEGDFEAVYLQEVMQYFPAANSLYWTNWRGTDVAGHPATLMVRREAAIKYPTQGGTVCLGDDSEVVRALIAKGTFFMDELTGEDTVVARALIARGRVGYLAGMPHLFIYVSHGANSWPDGHHRMLADKLAISQALLRRREVQIREGMAAHGLSKDTLSVVGNNGPAFTL